MAGISERVIYLFRHGQTDWNREGRIQGHLDVELNEAGREQARILNRHVRRLGIEALLSSDLSRARETAEIMGQGHGLPIFTDPGLREIYLGKVQGLTRDEIISKFGTEFSHRLRTNPLSDADIAFLGSESGDQVRIRALSAIEQFLAAQPYRCVGVSSHGGVVRRLLQFALGTEDFPAPVPNSCLYPLYFEAGRWRLGDQMPLR